MQQILLDRASVLQSYEHRVSYNSQCSHRTVCRLQQGTSNTAAGTPHIVPSDRCKTLWCVLRCHRPKVHFIAWNSSGCQSTLYCTMLYFCASTPCGRCAFQSCGTSVQLHIPPVFFKFAHIDSKSSSLGKKTLICPTVTNILHDRQSR